MAVGKLKRVSNTIPMKFLMGKDGEQGKEGKDGINGLSIKGKDGKDGVGLRGEPGRQGEAGSIPAHQVSNGEVRFQNPDGTWGDWIEAGVRSTGGGGGKISTNTYHKVATAEYHVNRNQLDLGTNIFGVDFNGDVTIFLPKSIDKRSLIIINDESSSAATNNITIQVEE
jgi:hypothetical protein